MSAESQHSETDHGEGSDDALAEIAASAGRMPPERWAAAQQLASEIENAAVLPVLGAGASYPCDVPLASTLGMKLVDAIEGGRIPLGPRPDGYENFKGDPLAVPPRGSDLGRVADLICLEHDVGVVLDELEFGKHEVWPPGEDVAKQYATTPHPCAYRILARMTRERFLSEAVTFNYDCHFEGALLKEGFQPASRLRVAKLWPDRFDVVADARSNARLIPRGDFVLNKVHGCVQTWRARIAEAAGDMDGQAAANSAIVIRWSQLLDWRRDHWARDLVRDRARRHILILIGFSGEDPVIHSSLTRVLEEVRSEADDSESRVRVIDLRPDTLALRLLLAAGRGEGAGGRLEQLSVAGTGLAELLLITHVELVKLALVEEAKARGRNVPTAADPREALLQLGVVAPAIIRWTAFLLQATEAVVTGTGEAIDQFRDDLYVPLTADPSRTLQALDTERLLSSELGVAAADTDPLLALGFYRRRRDPRAFIPTGLDPEELERVAGEGTLRNVSTKLATPPAGLIPVAVASRDGELYAYAVETGRPVTI